MKKFFFILTVFILSLTGGIIFAACDVGTSPETPPSNQTSTPKLEKSSFSITYQIGDGGVEYDLIWGADNAVKYKVECGETEIETTKPKYSLTNLSADTVHTVTVTAIGENNLQSQPVELKFKGTKLETPKNVRLYEDEFDGTSFGWDGRAESSSYLISFEELDLEIETSKPFGTGKFRYVQHYFTEHLHVGDLRSIFKDYELYSLESLRVQILPCFDSYKVFDYKSDTDVLELNLPSDFSEQSVNLYAGDLSNPTNIRWGETLDEYGNATVKWDGAISDYEYKVLIHYPDGTSSGMSGEKGASEGKAYFNNQMTTGDYTVTVEPDYDEFHYIGKDDDAKSVTYMFYLPQPVTETLSFHLTQNKLETPKNVHIENGYIVCDKVENAKQYVFSMKISKDSAINLGSYTNRISLENYLNTAAYLKEDGFVDLIVYVYNDGTDLTGFDNNGNPNIIVYEDSESAVISDAMQLKRIPAVQNVRIDNDTHTVSWDGVDEAETYEIMFQRADGSGNGGTVTGTQFQWDDNMDISDYVEMVITAKCKFEVTTENGITVMNIPSKYSTPIK